MTSESNKDNIMRKIKQNMLDKLELVGEFVESEAKLRCPVDTGMLRNTITHDVNPDGTSVRIGTSTEYAPYVELGTVKMSAQPFLRPAVLENKSRIQAFLNK